MDYITLVKDLKDSNKEQYYTLLTLHSSVLVREVSLSTRNKVAKEIGMSPQAFSTAYPLILSLVYPYVDA